MPQRAAIVTGASSGIGLALAHLLGEEGHALTIASRRAEKLESARRGTNLMSMALEKLSAWSCPNCVCLCCDITTLGRSVT